MTAPLGSAGPLGSVGPAGSVRPTGEWEPANEVERALAEAVRADRRADYFRLLTEAQLYLPTFADDEPGQQRFVTIEFAGRTYLPVFTSPHAQLRALGVAAPAYTLVTYAELRAKWPFPEHHLAIDPGSPIDAFLPVEAVAEAAEGTVTVPTASELVAVGPVEAMAAAVERADGAAYLAALVDATVFVATSGPVPADPVPGPDFPWRITDRGTIEVYPVPGPVPAVWDGTILPMAAILAGWPDPARDLDVMAEDGPMRIPGTSVRSLALTLLDEDDL